MVTAANLETRMTIQERKRIACLSRGKFFSLEMRAPPPISQQDPFVCLKNRAMCVWQSLVLHLLLMMHVY